MKCDLARQWVPLYLDGELPDDRSADLRPHLLECPKCRGAVQEAQSLKGWFVPSPAVAVPQGFAARVARLAVTEGAEPNVLRPWSISRGAMGSVSGKQGPMETSILQFSMRAVAVAALVLMVLAIAIRRVDLPGSEKGLEATPARTLEDVRESLRALNEAEASEAPESAEEGDDRPDDQ